MTLRQQQYLEYLKTDHWKQLRKAVFVRDGYCCVRCKTPKRLQAHHKFYRKRFEDSLPDDLIALCRSCHEQEHGLSAGPRPADCPAWITSQKDLQAARSVKRITRQQFKAWMPHFAGTKKPKARRTKNPNRYWKKGRRKISKTAKILWNIRRRNWSF